MRQITFMVALFVALSVNAKEYQITVKNKAELKQAKIELAKKYFNETGEYCFSMTTKRVNGIYIIMIGKTKSKTINNI